jgi:hypothetical protein
MGCELGSRPIELENRETMAAVERFEYRDSRARGAFEEVGHKESRWILFSSDKQTTEPEPQGAMG